MFQRVPVSKPGNPELLNEPIQFRNAHRCAKNRILKAAMSERLGTWVTGNWAKTGIPTTKYHNLYEKFGHGGFGTILTGNIMVSKNHMEAAGNVLIEQDVDTEERRSAFRKAARAAKGDGSLFIGQLNHCGNQTPAFLNNTPFSASSVQVDSKKVGIPFGEPVPLSVSQIQTEVVDKFVFAAQFLYETGFDGVELHGANGFLLANFMSPRSNKRTDEYGGGKEQRVRLALQIFAAIRSAIPAATGFLVGIKMNALEFQNDGLAVEEAVWMCREFERVGFDFIELSGGNFEESGLAATPASRKREAFFEPFARQIKPAVPGVPVFVTGGFRTTRAMAGAVRDGACDGVGLARPAAAEPDIAAKILKLNVQSATRNTIEDTRLQILAAGTQLVQAGKLSLAQSHQEPSFGLLDTSNHRETDKFVEALMTHLDSKTSEMAKGNVENIAFDCPIFV